MTPILKPCRLVIRNLTVWSEHNLVLQTSSELNLVLQTERSDGLILICYLEQSSKKKSVNVSGAEQGRLEALQYLQPAPKYFSFISQQLKFGSFIQRLFMNTDFDKKFLRKLLMEKSHRGVSFTRNWVQVASFSQMFNLPKFKSIK